MMESKSKNRLGGVKEVVSWIIWLAAAFIISQLLNRFILVNAEVVSGSMETTILTGDRVFGLRTAYWFGAPHRGDIIVFANPINPKDEPYIKRVVGLPGERISVRGDKVYINGRLLNESEYLDFHSADEYRAHGFGQDYAETLIPDDCYFMMGDNRNRSKDSREWGFMPREDILGKVYIDVNPSNFQFFGRPEYGGGEGNEAY
jgi:signal peptidase I